MSDLWLGDVGIRVTNLERSIDFYTKVFDLEEIDRGGDEDIQDPDGIFCCLYDHPEEPWEGPIPDHY